MDLHLDLHGYIMIWTTIVSADNIETKQHPTLLIIAQQVLYRNDPPDSIESNVNQSSMELERFRCENGAWCRRLQRAYHKAQTAIVFHPHQLSSDSQLFVSLPRLSYGVEEMMMRMMMMMSVDFSDSTVVYQVRNHNTQGCIKRRKWQWVEVGPHLSRIESYLRTST